MSVCSGSGACAQAMPDFIRRCAAAPPFWQICWDEARSREEWRAYNVSVCRRTLCSQGHREAQSRATQLHACAATCAVLCSTHYKAHSLQAPILRRR